MSHGSSSRESQIPQYLADRVAVQIGIEILGAPLVEILAVTKRLKVV